MKQILLFFSLLIFAVTALAQETERRFVYFGYNNYQLTPEAQSELDTMLAITKNCTITRAELYGHTDNKGDPEANKLLARNRINSVKAYLLSHNVPQSVFVEESFGEEKPAFSNETEAGQQKNRRVEVVFTYSCAPAVHEEIPPAETPERHSYEFINLQLSSPVTSAIKPLTPCAADTEHFTCRGDKEILIKGKQGTEIMIYKNCMVDANGKTISGEIDFVLIEVYKQSDMIRFGLATVSNGKLLESGGMIYLDATYNGQPARFSDNAWAYQISFPTNDKKPNMGIFYADSVAGPTNWIPAANSILSDMTYVKNQEQLDKYVFNATEMGWINCDYFLREPNKYKVTDVFVDMTDTAGVSFALVFKDINSTMVSGGGHGEISFNNVPIGYVVTLIAFRKNENTYSWSSTDFSVEKNHRQSVTMQELSEADFQKRLKELD